VKRLYWTIVGIIIGVVLTVFYVPGVAEYIEGTLLSWVAGLAG
jgi:hypothetical protein